MDPNAQVKNIRYTDKGGKTNFYSGNLGGISALGDASVYNVPVGSSYYSGLASGLQSYGQSQTTAQTAGATTPTYTPYASDSSSVVAQENKTVNDLQGYIANSANVKGAVEAADKSISDLDSYLEKLDKRRQDEIDRITQEYEEAKASTQEGQRREKASTTTALTTRLGGYLGGSASHVGVLNNLAVTHRAELKKLDSQRDAAIAAAKNAIEDKEFAVARMKADEIKSLENTIYSRQQDFFDNVIKLQAEGRASRGEQADRIKDYLDTLTEVASVDGEINLDPARAADIDAYYGVPGFTQQYMEAARTAAVAETEKQRYDSLRSYINLLQDIPAGVEVPFGDETVVGIGKAADVSTYLITDSKSGIQYVASYNKGSGSLSLTSTGLKGKVDTSSIPDDIKSNAMNNALQMLTEYPHDATGKVPAFGYENMIERLRDSGLEEKYPGIIQYVHDQFLEVKTDSLGDALENTYLSEDSINYLQERYGVGFGYSLSPGSGYTFPLGAKE